MSKTPMTANKTGLAQNALQLYLYGNSAGASKG